MQRRDIDNVDVCDRVQLQRRGKDERAEVRFAQLMLKKEMQYREPF